MDGLLVGRFQPFHLGHMEALRFALSHVEGLWVGIGSSNRPPDADNPFSATERMQMIAPSIGCYGDRVSMYPIPDAGDHKEWVRQIGRTVPGFGAVFSNDDLTCRLYSGLDVRVIRIPLVQRERLSGTNIRRLLRAGGGWEELVPEGTRKFLAGRGDLYK